MPEPTTKEDIVKDLDRFAETFGWKMLPGPRKRFDRWIGKIKGDVKGLKGGEDD